MKKLLLISLAAFVMTNCAKESVVDSDLDKSGNTIGFTSYSNITRGNPVDDNSEFMTSGNSFGVTAFISLNAAPYMGVTNAGAQIVSDGTAWDYADAADARFWPMNGETLSFYAYAPFTDNNRVAVPLFDKTNGMIFTNYQVPTTVADQKDFMYALSLNASKPTVGTAVDLVFHHAMTQILFKAQTEDANLYVEIEENGITLHNIASKGTFTLAAGGTAAWTNNLDLTAYTAPSAPVTVHGATASEVFIEDKVLMLLPQTFTAWDGEGTVTEQTTGGYLSLTCKIYYEVEGVKQYLKGDADNFATIYVPFSSRKGNDEIWNMRNKITYTLLINGSVAGLDPIKFTTEVEDWDDKDGGEIEL